MGVYDYRYAEQRDIPESAVMMPGETALQGNDIKVYVAVVVRYEPDGRIRPLRIGWEDGRFFEVDKVINVAREASLKAGGCGIRYRCRVMNQTVDLFFEGNGRWFVSRKTDSKM